MKDELGGKNNDKICWIKSKNLILTYLIVVGSENKKAEDTKKCHKKCLTFANYKNCFEATQLGIK